MKNKKQDLAPAPFEMAKKQMYEGLMQLQKSKTIWYYVGTAVYYCRNHDQLEVGSFKSCWDSVLIGYLED